MTEETLYDNGYTKAKASGNLIFITKDYPTEDWHDSITLTASEMGEIVKAWNDMGGIKLEFV